MADLEQRYRALSRQFHPDYFYNASAAERRQSLERSSYLNDAYRTLKNPIGRVEYLLKIEGVSQSYGETLVIPVSGRRGSSRRERRLRRSGRSTSRNSTCCRRNGIRAKGIARRCWRR